MKADLRKVRLCGQPTKYYNIHKISYFNKNLNKSSFCSFNVILWQNKMNVITCKISKLLNSLHLKWYVKKFYTFSWTKSVKLIPFNCSNYFTKWSCWQWILTRENVCKIILDWPSRWFANWCCTSTTTPLANQIYRKYRLCSLP